MDDIAEQVAGLPPTDPVADVLKIPDQTLARLAHYGVPNPVKPEKTAILVDFANAATPDITEQMMHLSGWIAWAEAQKAEAELLGDVQDFALEQHKAQRTLQIRASGVKMTEATIEATLTTDPYVQRMEVEVFRQQAYSRLLQSRIEGLTRQYNTLSRELSRRTVKMEGV